MLSRSSRDTNTIVNHRNLYLWARSHSHKAQWISYTLHWINTCPADFPQTRGSNRIINNWSVNSFYKLSQLQYNLPKEASNISFSWQDLSGILLWGGHATEWKVLSFSTDVSMVALGRMDTNADRVISAMFFYLCLVGKQCTPIIIHSVCTSTAIMLPPHSYYMSSLS